MRRLARRALPLGLACAVAFIVTRRPPEQDPIPPAPAGSVVVLAADPPTVPVLRIYAKTLIAREVADGRRSLAEAAALFGMLNRLPPAWTLPDRPLDELDPSNPTPARTEAERLCWQVVSWVARDVRLRAPGRVTAAVARLEAEFQDEVRRRGEIRLPGPAALESVPALLARVRASLTEGQRRDVATAEPGDGPGPAE